MKVAKKNAIKAYKMFNHDWTCRNFKYEIGKEYHHKGEVALCSSGFHACRKLVNCFEYYDAITWNKIAEVEIWGEVYHGDDGKSVASNIKIIEEMPFLSLKDFVSSDGVNGSYGVNRSYGVNGSYGIFECQGISTSIFCSNQQSEPKIFNTPVSNERCNKVYNKIKYFSWKPTFNNLKSLYLKNGSEWKLTPIPMADEISKKEAWADMPKEMLDYIKSLPEFNAEIFETITGIKTKEAK